MSSGDAGGGDGGGTQEPNRIMVYLRIRPAKKGEIDPANGTTYLLDVQPDNKTAVLESKNYCYDWIFNGDAVEQEDIYKKVAEPVIDNVFKGFWGTVMVYGQTGTGKSFTMCNFNPKQQGIIPRTMKYIFDTVERDTERTYTICFSFIQIYLDKLQDLFNPEAQELKINRDKDGVQFPGITEHIVKDADDFRRLYDDGNQYRVVTATKMNPESSRGHAALFIQLKSVPRDDPSGEVRNGKLFLIDLAGYERFSKTGVQEGLMAQEAKTINASLLSLGNVVQALSDKSDHIPWRNAKLTRMLEDAVGGRAKCSIILTTGPSSEHLHETLGTLYFGSRAMSIKTNAKLAVNIDYKKLAAKLQEMLSVAEGRISALEIDAKRRQLEREEAEAAFQAESARVKKRQEEQLQELLTSGATREKIEEFIRCNQQENELLEEQQWQQRTIMEERHEEEVKQAISKNQEEVSRSSEESTANMSRDINELHRQLAYERSEKEKFKSRWKEAESEGRRHLMELNEAKMQLESAELGMSGGGSSAASTTPGSPAAAGSGRFSAEMKRELEKRVESVRIMMEENFALKLADVEEPLREQLEKFKKDYDDIRRTLDTRLQEQKDKLTSSYEAEIAELRRTSADVQEKLKKNHLTIKKSYQDQKESVTREKEDLEAYVEMLTAQIQKLGAAPVKRPIRLDDDSSSGSVTGGGANQNTNTPKRSGVSPDGSTDKLVQELQQKVKDLQVELDYVTAEKEGLTKQSSANFSKQTGEERLTPAQVRAIKVENEELKAAKQAMEMELMKLKAAQILSVPQDVGGNTGANNGDDDDDSDEEHEDMHGDQEGLATFASKVLTNAYFDASTLTNTFQQISTTLTADLDDYRRVLRHRLVLLGGPGVGKSSIVKCMLNNTPIIKACPEVVTPTIQPVTSLTTVDDLMTSKADWFKAYVQFQDVEPHPTQQSGGSSLLGTLNPLNVFGGGSQQQKGVAEPARVYVELVDLPGERSFFHAIPPNLLPSKNVIYCITYDMTQTLEQTKVFVEQQLALLHACTLRMYSKLVGGNSARVGFALIGTRRDEMRDKSEHSVVAFLNKLIIALGDVFFRLRGEDTAGLVCVGNFATSAREWSVVSTKGDRGPRTFRELAQHLGMIAVQLYPNTPPHFLPSSQDKASHVTYMMGDDMMENVVEKTSHLLPVQQRLRKGIITLLTGLFREQKARWAMAETDLRKLVAEHLQMDVNTLFGNRCVSYVIRELAVRGVVVVVPHVVIEPKYLPRCPEDARYKSSNKPLPRDGVVVLDPLRFWTLYSTFVLPKILGKLPSTSSLLKETRLFDAAAILKQNAMHQRGVLPQETLQTLFQPMYRLFNSNIKLVSEFLAVSGLGISLRSEAAILAPGHITPRISLCLTDYLSYLTSVHGDGLGRRYKLNAAPSTFFSRLQTKLTPFSNAPAKEANFLKLNWSDASLLVLEKTRLKWGIFGSKALKDAVMAAGTPVRGLLKIEGELLFLVITAKGSDSTTMINVCRNIVDAIQQEISALCSREFRGVKAQFQELTLVGFEAKRARLSEGIETILGRHGASPIEIAEQKSIIGTFTKGKEMEDAVQALRSDLCDDDE